MINSIFYNKKIHGHVLFRWFASYLAILLIPLVFSIIIYFYSFAAINNSSKEIYEASFEQFRIEMDNFAGSAYQALQQLSMDSDIQALTLVKTMLQPKDQWNMVQAIKQIRTMQIILPMVNDIFVVFNPLNSIVNSSGYYSIDLFYNLYFLNESINLESFKSIIRDPGQNKIILVNDRILLLLASTEGFSGDTSATLVISYKKEIFDDRFLRSYESNGGKIYIVPDNHQNTFGSGENSEFALLNSNGVNTYGDSSSKKLIGNTGYRILTLYSKLTDWKYFYFLPETLEKAKARQIQFITFAGLFGCTLLGLFLSYILSRRNYDPVKKLMAVFNRSEGTGNNEAELNRIDEFKWIENKALDAQAALGRNFRALKKYFINTLLNRPFDPVNGKPEIERYKICLNGDWNIVMVFALYLPGFGKILSENESEIINTLHQIIIHIFLEAVGENFTAEMISTGEYVSAIVNWPGNDDSFIERLEDLIEYTQQEAGEFFHLPVLTALGEPRRGLEGIYYSNLEALETLGFLDPKTGQTILHYRDVKYFGGRFQYNYETEQKLINLVRLGDSENTCNLLQQIWTDNSYPHNRSGRMNRLLAYNLLGSLIKGMEQDILTNDLLSQSFNLENIEQENLAITLEKAAVEICKFNISIRRDRQNHRLSKKVKNYINENFRNPDINISITSLHFGMNPAYLSTVFKEETGTSLLEYINTLRIEEGKKYLSSGCEVNEAAEKCGFRGSGAFIRVFKKLTGVTPGQFREI
ncbi:MAG: helix-turn-helix transcriptional regulator [Treponema sp.]|nr:helix-turn-helix transcriptional regulator [Treponema sp.]